MSRYTMDEVLKDEKLFREKFCVDATFTHLGRVPVEALRAAIQMIHGWSGFHAASTPRYYSSGDDMPVVIFGNLTTDGKMRSPRFGLTTQCSASNQPHGEKLFLYVSDQALQAVQGADRVVASWLQWREDTADPSRAMPVPIWENKSQSADLKISENFSEMVAQSGSLNIGETMTLGDLLKLLGSQLNLTPKVCREFTRITGNLDLAPDCITPRAAEIMKDQER